VREYAYTVTEHAPERPWIIRSREHRTVELEDGDEFFAWAEPSGTPSSLLYTLTDAGLRVLNGGGHWA
jgi:hypothetical protein